MSRPDRVERWRAAVLADRSIPDAPRVLALVLADRLDRFMHASVKRAVLAEQLGVHGARIDERVRTLRRAGYLALAEARATGAKPAPDRPGQYTATFPDEQGSNAPGGSWNVDLRSTGNVDNERSRLHRERPNGPMGTSETDVPGPTGRVPIETPDQNDHGATGAHPLRTAGSTTVDDQEETFGYTALPSHGQVPGQRRPA